MMKTIHPQYIIDDKGKRISVLLPINEYHIILDQLDELEDIRI